MNTPHSFSSRIAERISRKLIRIYTMIYLLLLLFLLLILTPLLYHESVRKSTQLQSVLTADYELLHISHDCQGFVQKEFAGYISKLQVRG